MVVAILTVTTGLWAVVLGLGAAVLLGLGFVLQQRVARLLPHSEALSPRLFLDLVRKPTWLLGVAVMVCGQLLGAAAFSAGEVSVVEPLLATNLLFALLVMRWLSAQRLSGAEWGGAVALVCGVVVFLICASPRAPAPGSAAATGLRSAFSLVVGGLAAGGLTGIACHRTGAARGLTFAAGAGLLFGMQDGLTRGVLVGGGVRTLVASWATYALVAAAVCGLMLMQSAFEAAPLRTSLPMITAVEPLAGIGYGIGVFGEHVRTAAVFLTGEIAGLVMMVVGIVLVAQGGTLHRHHSKVGRQ